ncbi:hypothetical protein M5K25_003524 [Dendrobium thyrsiflorum]|uniref:Reverse transcriptase zinc-binding domain-containing protein n=1 Tax=Dendrobium thyrsiflorum TaxID=117978 RepID=A0ABD0VRR8_DENTH
MVKAAGSIASSITFNITTQSKFAFLWDPWVGGSSINTLCSTSNLTDTIPHLSKVSDFILDGNWSLPDLLRPTILPFIQNILLHQDHNNPIGWKDNKRISFSSFITYYFREEVPFCWHKLIWHKHHALKYSCYTWLAINGGLKTADELIKRNIGVNSLCSLCFTFNETMPHLFFECDYAFAALKSLIPCLGDFLLRPRLTDIFLFLEGRSYHSKHQKIIHLLKVCCAVYFIWRERNERRFNNTYRSSATLCALITNAHLSTFVGWTVIPVVGGNALGAVALVFALVELLLLLLIGFLRYPSFCMELSDGWAVLLLHLLVFHTPGRSQLKNLSKKEKRREERSKDYGKLDELSLLKP